jgi:rhodanese-related sulfurtransferase
MRRSKVAISRTTDDKTQGGLKIMEATRVTVEEITERMKKGEPFTFIDSRNPKAWNEAGEKLPGAIRVPADEVANHLAEIPRDRVIITYCT